MAETTTAHEPIRFETHPERYVHWRLEFPSEHAGKVARIVMDIQEERGLRPGYPLKLNSYDLGVDIELADALQRIRFEHPEVQAVVVTSGKDRIFCSGANIYMLGSSTHGFKVNFCKFTNETRLYLEQMSAESGIPSLCAVNGTASGGGYELAIACDDIVLADDGSSAVSFPEAPLLAVLPGTGGLTRLVDKRKIRRDLADAFSTIAEGVRGKRAVEWGLVDAAPPKAKFEEVVKKHVEGLLARSARKSFPPVTLGPLEAKRSDKGAEYKYVSLALDAKARTATLTVRGPSGKEPTTPDELAKAGASAWAIQAFRELDDALLDLRFNQPTIGVVAIKTSGNAEDVLAVDAMLAKHKDDGLVREVLLQMKRVLKRLDLTAKSFFALVEPSSCFVGSLLELGLAADRIYMKEDDDGETFLQSSPLNAGFFPMANGLSRLQTRFLKEPERVSRVLETAEKMNTQDANKAGLVTFAPDDIDWDDEIRIAFEERAAMSPDAMTGMEASLRFAGPETLETKIFGRLSAWQNWIFQRPNAVGEKGALTLYGKPERPEFKWART
ncbi:Benzoyl-CoA-dihydrodiol lyase [Labilithrix luteola]|uniref:Benzoyl-CoA-dihydrodiol lyase n=1 Tax=Labilithrix luteola TaxID=1391654 RepID=A0A0K1Q0N2_9BACT|nr:2,3-epoxybenzoyl-CoA dihydrolase [Labilithrix luteola]AKU98969.1 Benzoyl-CoA-dihydrodiol lyase [Labilithrix luteola]